MPISSDFTIDYVNKTVKHSSGSTTYTVNALYTYLMDDSDELANMKYPVSMTAQTPTEYTLPSGWFIDETTYQFLYNGAITTSGYNAVVYVLTFQSGGYVSAIAGDLTKTVHDGGSTHTGVLLDYNNTTRKWWVRKAIGTFANSDALTITSGTGAGTVASSNGVQTGEAIFANIFTLGTLASTPTIYVYQNDVKITTFWSSGQIDVILKTKEFGTLIDSGNLFVFARAYGTLYDNYTVTAASGRNPIPLATFADANNTTASGTVGAAPYTSITFAFGARSKNLNNGNGAQPYDAEIDCAGLTMAQVYEYCKYVTRAGSATTLNGVAGEYYIAVGDIRVNYTGEASGPFVQGELITGTGGGTPTGYLVSLIDNGATGTLVIRNTHGTFTNGQTITGAGGCSATINGAPTSITAVKQAPFGTYAGGTFFAARGVWLSNYAGSDANNFVLIDATGTTQNPPATISITVNSVVSGDQVSVFRVDGSGNVDKSIYTSHASANSSGAGTFTATASIASDTPSTGQLRAVARDAGGVITAETIYAYTSWSGAVFTLSGTLSATYDANDTAYVPFIDTTAGSTSVSVSITYVSDRDVVTRVRHKGIVPFSVSGTVTTSGLTVTAIRTTDDIVT